MLREEPTRRHNLELAEVWNGARRQATSDKLRFSYADQPFTTLQTATEPYYTTQHDFDYGAPTTTLNSSCETKARPPVSSGLQYDRRTSTMPASQRNSDYFLLAPLHRSDKTIEPFRTRSTEESTASSQRHSYERWIASPQRAARICRRREWHRIP